MNRRTSKNVGSMLTLRLSKFCFSDNLYLDYVDINEEKVPVQKLFPSQSIKSQAHVLTFYVFTL